MENPAFPHRINRIVEADFEYTVDSFSNINKRCFHDTHPGYLEIDVFGCQWEAKNRTIRDLYEAANSDGLLQTYKFKQYIADRNDDSRTNYTIVPKIVYSLLADVPVEHITITSLQESVEKASISAGFNIEVNQEIQLKYSMDFTFLFRLDWMPKITREWAKRPRSWPPTNALEDVLKKGYVISKSSSKEKHNLDTTEFRYSFAHIERRIVALQSPTQRLVYLIFKSLLYRWIIPVDRNVTSSYIAKSTMLWTCQECPPTDELWENDNLSIINAVKFLFGQLLEYFKSDNLPYYFVPGINIIENYGSTTKSRIKIKIQNILTNFQSAIPNNLREVVAFLIKIHATKTKPLNYINLSSNFEAIILWLTAKRPSIMIELSKHVNQFDDFLKNPRNKW